MSLNENLKTRRTQLAVLVTVLTLGAATAGGVVWYGNHQEQQKHPAPAAAPFGQDRPRESGAVGSKQRARG